MYTLHQKPIWITEFNANVNRPPAVHEAFMKLALPWLDQDPRVERYAYFFGNDVPARAGGVLTSAGQTYSSHVSTPAYPENISDKRPAFPDNVPPDITNLVLSVEEPANSSFVVYPSVTDGEPIRAIFDNVSTDAQLTVFTHYGKLVNTHSLAVDANSKVIETASLQAGIYILTLDNKDTIQSKRFVKQ